MDEKSGFLILLAVVILSASNIFIPINGLPANIAYSNESESYQILNDTNATDEGQDLLVIKTVVYEIGILTNASDDENDTSTETEEQVDLTFFNPETHGHEIDLSHIPIPIQTNVSGVSVTGIAPANFGIIHLPENDDGKSNLTFTSPVIPNAVVSVHRHVSTTNQNKTSEILHDIEPLVNIPQLHIEGVDLNNSTSEKDA